MFETNKVFLCANCLVEFKITVEPGYDLATILQKYPGSLAWLNNPLKCPVCSAHLDNQD